MTRPYVRLDRNEAAVLLVDHQAGLLSLVRDFEPSKLKVWARCSPITFRTIGI